MAEIFKCSFAVSSESDSVISIGGAGYSDTTVAGLVAINPQFWIEKDTNGNSHLCTAKTDQAALQGSFENASGTYGLKAVNFEVLELVGGRPISRPHAY